MNNRSIALLAGLFSLLFAFQLATGAALFWLKLGGLEGLEAFYMGDEATFAAPKSFDGLVKTGAVHFLAMGLIVFLFAHFLFALRSLSEKAKSRWSLLLAFAAFGDIVTHLAAPYWYGALLAKGFFFFLFEGTLCAVIFLIGRNYLKPAPQTC